MGATANPLYSLFTFGAAIALVVLLGVRLRNVFRREHRVHVSDVSWTLLYVVLLLIIGVFCVIGSVAYDAGALDLGAYSVVLLLCGSLTLFGRPAPAPVAGMTEARNRNARHLNLEGESAKDAMGPSGLLVCIRQMGCSLLVVAAVSIASAWMIDYLWLESSGDIQVKFFAVTSLLFFVVGVALFFLGRCHGAPVLVVPLCAAGFGIAQYFVVSFKGVPIMPTDLLSLNTAVAVAGGYSYVLTSRMVLALCAVGICACALSFLRPPRIGVKKVRIVSSVASALAGIAVAGGLLGTIANTPFEEALDYPYDRWMPITTYQALGFVPAFIEVAQDFPIPVPDGYSKEGASELMDDLAAQFDVGMGATPGRQAAEAQFEELKPTVIAVMNESFADLSIYDELRAAGYTGPQFYNSLTGTVQRGALMVSVSGGGTANSEFEFLTGNSLAFIGAGKYPYQLYDLSDCDSLVKQFESLGYASTAIHPQDPNNWKRSTVYDQLGFDEFISMEEFQSAPIYHSGSTDASTYDKIIEVLERDAGPQFIFDVTMQNHGGYAPGTVPEEDMVYLDVPGVDNSEVLSELGVYLACVNRSDHDLAYFIDRLRNIGRPVVLVFFGDHQPSVTSALGDALCIGTELFDRELKKCESTYLVWSNYEVAGSTLDSLRVTSASQLASQVLYAIGAPLTERQKADLVLSEEVPAVSLVGWKAADGQQFPLDAKEADGSVIELMRKLQYLNFGENIG